MPEKIMKKHGKYSVKMTTYKRFKADTSKNRNILANETTEYLHCLIKE